MRALSSIPFCPCDGRWVSLGYLSAGCRYTTSRQELEEITAVHASHATEVEAARQRLLLLGLSRGHVEALNNPSQIVSDIIVPAPIAGVITSRTANLGQVVSMAQELFVVTDLAQVWVIGDLYEQDFQTVRVGSEAAL